MKTKDHEDLNITISYKNRSVRTTAINFQKVADILNKPTENERTMVLVKKRLATKENELRDLMRHGYIPSGKEPQYQNLTQQIEILQSMI